MSRAPVPSRNARGHRAGPAGVPENPFRPGAWPAIVARAAHRRWNGRGCLFTFHRAAPAAEWADLPNRGFYLDLDFLDRLLAHLRRSDWEVVTLDEAVRRCERGGDVGRFANFSVDDCYRDTAEQVVPLFRRHGVPVTLFLTTGIPDRTMPLWGAGLESIVARREQVIDGGQVLATRTAREKRDAFARLAAAWDGPASGERYHAFCAANGFDAEALDREHAITWEQLEALRDDPLVELGGHTVSHPRVSSLGEREALAEIEGCAARMEERLGRRPRHFAFPYGRSGDCGTRDFDLVRRAGYRSAATTRKGLAGAGQDPFRLPRNTLNGAHRSLAAAEAHLWGVTGAAARVLGRV